MPISISQLRAWLAPPGSRRESLGRKIVQGVILGARRRFRIAWQRTLRAAGVSLPPLLPPRPQSPGVCPYDVLCLPIIAWGFRFQRPQQMMRQFAQGGHRVFYLSQDFLLVRPLVVAEIERNVYGLRLPADAASKAFDDALAHSDVRGMADGVACLHAAGILRQVVVVVQHPYWTPLAGELKSRFGWPIVYDCMDDYARLRRQPAGVTDLEDNLVQMADLTVATSDRLLARVAPRARRAALVRNGVDYGHFARAEPAFVSGTLRVPPAADVVIGYYGAIAHWFDARLVAELARLRPAWRFELVGNTFSSELGPLAGLSNVSLLGEMPYAELPRRLARWHCCIIPFLRNELTEATNPVKVYEMLAAGMPVVAVDLPELRPIAAAGLIELADDAAGFARKIESLLAVQSPAASAARREFARQNTWQERYRELSAAMAPLECSRHTPCAVGGETPLADGTRRVPATKAA